MEPVLLHNNPYVWVVTTESNPFFTMILTSFPLILPLEVVDTGRQQQEKTSPNHVVRLQPFSVVSIDRERPDHRSGNHLVSL